MTDQPELDTTLVAAVADWLRQFHPADPTVANWLIDEMRSALLMRFLKAVAQESGLSLEVGPTRSHAKSGRWNPPPPTHMEPNQGKMEPDGTRG